MVHALKDVVNFVTAPAILITVAAVVFFLALRYRAVWKPQVALAVAAFGAAFFALSLFDPNFALIVTKPDNVPIVGHDLPGRLLRLVRDAPGAARTTTRIAAGRADHREASDGEAQKVFVWPDLVYTELHLP